ncbi:hypothetical protein [Peribacillus acanthi]|uniref:hypothetical protein n=1 Tax=Peribacillus acanthi TaxID=2171554 RepID=UPI000D3E1AF0|nr:hypothetical protein [Peribacillus acanthi]
MTLKAIELQIALPRTFDAGKIQQQLQQRGQLANDEAALEFQNQTEWKGNAVVKKEPTNNTHLKRDGESRNNDSYQNKRKTKKKTTSNEKHPTKGNSIDFLG